MTAVAAWKAVGWFVGRAGVILFKGNRKWFTTVALGLGGVIVKRDDIMNRIKDEASDIVEEHTVPLLAAGAGIGIILLLVLFTRR